MKELNDEKQMRSDWWLLSLATGKERVKDENGYKAHSTQKPQDLLYRVILSSSNPGDVVLDPFFGSGTTGAVAKTLHRKWIGIEKEEKYIKVAKKRIDEIVAGQFSQQLFDVRSEKQSRPRVEFSKLVENGYLFPGQFLYFNKDLSKIATIRPDSRIEYSDGFTGSIHQVGRHLSNDSPCNGWDHWYVKDENRFLLLDEIRLRFLTENGLKND
jgi:modification methylase